MRLSAVAMVAVLAMSSVVQAEDCPLERATYGQPGDSWVLEITPRPVDGAANEFVGVKLTGPEGFPPHEGGIFVPNGFGQPMVDLAPQCGAGGTAGCTSYSDVIYALMPLGIEQFPYDFNAPVMAPEQILFPGFAAGVWYSPYRQTAFSEDHGLGDAFSFVSCRPE